MYAPVDLLEMMMNLDPTMATAQTNQGMTPIALFLKLKGINLDNNGAGMSLDHALQNGISWNDISKIMILDKSMIAYDEYAFVKAAASTECNLEVLYYLMMRSMDTIGIYAKTNTKKRKR